MKRMKKELQLQRLRWCSWLWVVYLDSDCEAECDIYIFLQKRRILYDKKESNSVQMG